MKTPVLMSFTPFDASTEDHLRSSLSSIHDAVKAAPFDHDVHHRGYETEAAHGSLEPPPTRWLRRTFLHLSYSTTLSHQRLHDTTTAGALLVSERSEPRDDRVWLINVGLVKIAFPSEQYQTHTRGRSQLRELVLFSTARRHYAEVD